MLMQEYECDSTLFSEQDVHGLIMIRVNISSNFFFGGGGGGVAYSGFFNCLQKKTIMIIFTKIAIS